MSDKLGPRKPDKEKDISKHFVNGEGKLFEDTNLELPDTKKADAEMRQGLKEKYSTLKKIIIQLGKLKLGAKAMNLIKLIGGLIGLVVAFLFVFILPGAGFELLVVGAIGSIFNALGFTAWRLNYGIIKEWYQSKTIWGSLMVVLPIIALVVLNFVSFGLPAWVITVLHGLIVAGGGAQIWGIFDAVNKASKTETFIK